MSIFRLRKFERRASIHTSPLHTTPDSEAPPTKRLRASDKFVAGAGSSTILLAIGILCKQEWKDIKHKLSGKWSREKLTKCELIQNELLIKAAEQTKYESLLTHIRDRDLVAAELRYHHSCYVQYANFLTYAITETDSRKSYPEAYEQFSSDVVKGRIIEGGEVPRMTRLCSLFQRKIKSVHNCDVIIKPHHLKERLLRDFRQLTFLWPRQRNQSEVVLSKKVMPDILVSSDDTTTLCSEGYKVLWQTAHK